jgi:uncharacterized alkaline shock family protein YloU
MGSPSSAQAAARGSARVPLARLALRAASEVPGVLGSDPGPQGLRVVADPPELLRGVSVTAEVDGRYAVDLCLVAGMVPLHALADEVRDRVRRRAERERLETELGTVNVEFAMVMSEAEATAVASAAVAEALDALAIGGAVVAQPTIEAESVVGTGQAPEAERTLGTEPRVVEAEPGIDAGVPIRPEEVAQPEAWRIEAEVAIQAERRIVPEPGAPEPARSPRPVEGDSPPASGAGEGRPA